MNELSVAVLGSGQCWEGEGEQCATGLNLNHAPIGFGVFFRKKSSMHQWLRLPGFKIHLRFTGTIAKGNSSPDPNEEIVPLTSTFDGGPYRARTDDIHGVNVALYQLS
jgi:hypothetical protein